MSTRLFICCVVTLLGGMRPLLAADEELNLELKLEPHKVVGHEKCTKCHAAELEVWKKTPHHLTFEALHRQPEAKQIAERLGLGSIKRNDVCIQCHYTMQGTAGQGAPGQSKAIAGVSCESCHGPAKTWLELHADYGGPHVTRQQESAAHRAQRVEQSIARGMRNPANIYLIARSCYNCHTVPHERLVNVGKHVAGSTDFELVAWSQGMLRHNFVDSDGKTNRQLTREQLRVMYVVGVMTDLEYSLKATALATQKANYGIVSARRAATNKARLERIQKLIRHPMVQEALDAVASVQLKLNHRQALEGAAHRVSAAAYEFAETADGRQLGEIDSMLPAAADMK